MVLILKIVLVHSSLFISKRFAFETLLKIFSFNCNDAKNNLLQ
jgi:hypothetical protein